MKFFKKIVSLFFAIAIICSISLFAFATESSTPVSRWDWYAYRMAAGSDSVGDFGFLFKYLGSYMSDTVCPTSSDNKHHGEVTGISGASRGGFYTAVCLCDYCGKAFEASCTSSDFDTAYNSYVSGLQSDLGTTTLLNGGYRHYFPLWSCGLGGTNSSFPYNLDVVEKSSPFLVSGSRDIDTTIVNRAACHLQQLVIL